MTKKAKRPDFLTKGDKSDKKGAKKAVKKASKRRRY